MRAKKKLTRGLMVYFVQNLGPVVGIVLTRGFGNKKESARVTECITVPET